MACPSNSLVRDVMASSGEAQSRPRTGIQSGGRPHLDLRLAVEISEYGGPRLRTFAQEASSDGQPLATSEDDGGEPH